MTAPWNPPQPEAELSALNGQLAEMLHRQPAELVFGAATAQADELVVCGVAGGKDVGKSTLVNALAQQRISIDEAEVGRGTDRPVAYAHREVEQALSRRLSAAAERDGLMVHPHDAAAVRNVVLIDLPDFDSEFRDHLEIVQRAAPLLDRIIWVVTPRKIGDRAWMQILQRSVKGFDNVYVVLNKLDELLTDWEANGPAQGERTRWPERFWDQQVRWIEEVLGEAGCPQPQDHRFMLAAAFPDPQAFVERIARTWDDPDWSTYAADKPAVLAVATRAAAELDRLRSSVLGPVSEEQARTIKIANRKQERAANIERLRNEYRLDEVVAELAHACDPAYHRELLAEGFDPELRAALAGGVAARIRTDRQLADEVLERRVERWPLLRLVYWPFGWLARMLSPSRSPLLSSVIGGGEGRSRAAEQAEAPDGTVLRDRIELVRATVVSDHAALLQRLHIEDRLSPAKVLGRRLETALARLPAQLEAEVLDNIRARERRSRFGGFVGKLGLWLILLWFPIVQPVSAGMLEMLVEEGTFRLAHGLYRVTTALSAVHLLSGLAVVAAIYIAIIAGMYGRGLRQVRAALGGLLQVSEDSAVQRELEQVLLGDVAGELTAPLVDRLRGLRMVHRRLAELAGE